MAVKTLVLIISCAAIAAGGLSVRTTRRMSSFTVTRGAVISRELARVPNTLGREGRWGKGGGFQPKVTYTYVVDGVGYTSDRWSYITEGLKRSAAQHALEAVPNEVDVHYDPANPQVAYLRRERLRTGYMLIACGVVGVLVAVAAVLV